MRTEPTQLNNSPKGVLSNHGKHKDNYFKDYYQKNKDQKKKARRKRYALEKLNKAIGSYTNFLKKEEQREKGNNTPPHTHTHISNASKREKEKRKDRNCSTPRKRTKKAIDTPTIRIKTMNKVPKRNNWPNWWEKWNIKELLEKYKEAGARTGKRVLYLGRWYFLYVLDEDFYKNTQDIPEAIRRELDAKGKERNEKWKVSYTNTTHGRHTIILSKEELPDLNIKYGDYTPTDFLGKGRQFIIFDSIGKEYIDRKKPFLIVKNFLGLKRKLNPWGYNIEQKADKKPITLTKLYKRTEPHQNARKNQSTEYKEGETFIIKEKILSIRAMKPTARMRNPHLVKTEARYFYLDSYFKNQEIGDLIGTTPTLQLKQGYRHQFLNKVYTRPPILLNKNILYDTKQPRSESTITAII